MKNYLFSRYEIVRGRYESILFILGFLFFLGRVESVESYRYLLKATTVLGNLLVVLLFVLFAVFAIFHRWIGRRDEELVVGLWLILPISAVTFTLSRLLVNSITGISPFFYMVLSAFYLSLLFATLYFVFHVTISTFFILYANRRGVKR